MTANLTTTAPDAAVAYILEAVEEHGEDAWLNVLWYFHAPLCEVEALVKSATHHVFRRGEYLADPRHAADLFHDEEPRTWLAEWGQCMAEREVEAERAEVVSFVASHQVTL